MAIIEIRLKSMSQLFDSLDPAPFHDKALDREVDAYLVESVDEYPAREPLTLLVRGPETMRGNLTEITHAVHAHFRREQLRIEWQLRRKMRLGRVALWIGLLVLAVSLLLRVVVESFELGRASILGEGLLIVGWVGLWRPAELLLFERLESRAERSVLRRLAQIPVTFEAIDDGDGIHSP